MKYDDLKQGILKDDQTLHRFLETNRIYGFSLAIVEDYNISNTVIFGIKNSDIMLQAASISKSIFSFTVMKLFELGLVDINENLAPIIKSAFPKLLMGIDFIITYQDLLNHTSGLNIHGFSGYEKNQTMPTLKQTLMGEKPSNSLCLRFDYSPRSRFSYSGGAYQLAQYLIESQMKESYKSLVERLVLNPLGMNHSIMPLSRKDINRSRIAQAWSSHDTPIKGGYIFYPELAAAGLWTTPNDLARFGIEMMKALQGRSMHLSKESAERMMTLPLIEAAEYGTGFRVVKQHNSSLFGHSGDNVGYHASMLFNPAKGSGIVVMINTDIGEEIPYMISSNWMKNERKVI